MNAGAPRPPAGGGAAAAATTPSALSGTASVAHGAAAWAAEEVSELSVSAQRARQHLRGGLREAATSTHQVAQSGRVGAARFGELGVAASNAIAVVRALAREKDEDLARVQVDGVQQRDLGSGSGSFSPVGSSTSTSGSPPSRRRLQIFLA